MLPERFVRAGACEPPPPGRRANAEELRYDSDYRLGGVSQREAEGVLADAEEFVAAVRALLS